VDPSLQVGIGIRSADADHPERLSLPWRFA
jgi:hypothetical protein